MTISINTTHPKGKLANFRDLGGYQAKNGTVRSNHLFRSDDIASIDQESANLILSKGITDIIDLRSPQEAAATGRGPLGEHPLNYFNKPLLADPAAPHELMKQMNTNVFTPEVLGTWYHQLLAEAITVVIDTLEIIEAAEGSVVFHCAAGKDRTGIIAACILSILEVEDSLITEDYARTDEVMPNVLARIIANDRNMDPSFISNAGALLEAPAHSMDVFLRLSREKDGGILNKLKENGLEESTIRRFRERFIA